MVYRIHALLICHDVRLNTSVESQVELDHIPSEQEAIQLLWPVGEERIARAWCEGCPFELYISAIEPVDVGMNSF